MHYASGAYYYEHATNAVHGACAHVYCARAFDVHGAKSVHCGLCLCSMHTIFNLRCGGEGGGGVGGLFWALGVTLQTRRSLWASRKKKTKKQQQQTTTTTTKTPTIIIYYGTLRF